MWRESCLASGMQAGAAVNQAIGLENVGTLGLRGTVRGSFEQRPSALAPDLNLEYSSSTAQGGHARLAPISC